MKKQQLFTTDEAIIGEYGRLYDELGASKKCRLALKNLAKQICPEKQNLWEAILDAIQYGLKVIY
jgi:hypothetical protein